jgi:hypothetical protein
MDTHTREIPREEWAGFFDSFSRQHDGWLVTLEVLGAGTGAEVEAREQPLSGITADLKDGEDAISILIGGASRDHVAHIIDAPLHVLIRETGEGAHESLRIEAANGTSALLRFRSAMLPEAVDGMVLHR